MKLGELKQKIRTTKGSPMLRVELSTGAVVNVALMKSSVMEQLDVAFPGGKNVETGLVYSIDGDNALIHREGDKTPYGASAAPLPGTKLSLLDDDDAPAPSAPAPLPTSTLLDL